MKHSAQQEFIVISYCIHFWEEKNALVRLHLVFPQVKAASISQNWGLLRVHHLLQLSSPSQCETVTVFSIINEMSQFGAKFFDSGSAESLR